MLTRIVLPLLLLTACDEPASSTSETKSRPTPATASTSSSKTATSSSLTTSALATASTGDSDPWEEVGSALLTLENGAISQDISKIMQQRKSSREVEDRQIERAVLDVVATMTEDCRPAGIEDRFDRLVEVESTSMAADREALSAVLSTAGPEGRAMFWDLASPETVLPKSRTQMAKLGASNLPSWLTSETDPDRELQARRILIGLKFTIEGAGLDTETRLAELEGVITNLDPEAEDAPAQVVEAMAKVDEALLAGQRIKFEKLATACDAIDSEYWLAMLERGSIAKYLGTYGGSTGVVDRSGTQGGGAMSSMGGGQGTQGKTGGQMGSSQMGQTGGQMGGSQMGQTGGQMGQTGGQMGGSQMGQTGGQMGQTGGQMGQTGGQMGQTGGQMGQTGGQMGQTGGQMGGGQMGQTGGQMGGGRMGQSGGGQMGGGTPQQGGSR